MEKLHGPVLTKISHYVSALFNPMISLIFYFIVFSALNNTLTESFFNFLPLLLLAIVPISGWIFWNVKRKRYTDADVSNRDQRKSLYIFIIAALIVYLCFTYVQSSVVDWVVLFLLILLTVLQISNYFIKSSMHMAINIFVAALFFTLSPWLGLLWLVISIIVGISRVILKRHSPAEVFTGALIGIFVSFIYLYIHIQTLN